MPEAPQALPRGTSPLALLELAGLSLGYVRSLDGGTAVGQVVEEKLSPDNLIHKHIASVKYEDVTFVLASPMAKDFYEWVKSVFDRKHLRKDLIFKRIDYDQNVISQLDVFHALLSGLTFPELDASSKVPWELAVRPTIDVSRMKPGTGKAASLPLTKAKRWMSSNFRLTIPGLDCTHVNRIAAMSLTEDVTSDPVGEQRDYQKRPAPLHVPNLVVSLPEHMAKGFYDWHRSFVIDGINTADKEKEGTLEILSADLKEVLFTLKLRGLGIFRLKPDNPNDAGEVIRRVTAEMYCESMWFDYGPGAVAG